MDSGMKSRLDGGSRRQRRSARKSQVPFSSRHFVFLLLAPFFFNLLISPVPTFAQSTGFKPVVKQVLPKTVKIFGAGGFRGLESYQSGVLISSEGHVLTVWSYVLDGDSTMVTLDDGDRFEAKLVGYDPRLEIAVLKIDTKGLPFYDLNASVEAFVGSKVLAFGNCYRVATGNEPVSVQHGVVSAVTKLDARRGSFQSPYAGDAILLDAVTNNPGSAGGIVTDRKGRLMGMIGKELRDGKTGAWLNFAIPVREISQSVTEVLSGKKMSLVDKNSARPAEPMTLQLLGFSLVPNVIQKTPPYVDSVFFDSAAHNSGLRRDDLVIEVNGQMTPSCIDVMSQLSTIDRDSTVKLTVQRGSEFVDLTLTLVKQ
jgi:serine protease Do